MEELTVTSYVILSLFVLLLIAFSSQRDILCEIGAFWKNYRLQSSKRPAPCLPCLPLIGSIPFLTTPDKLHLLLAEKAKRYGPVFGFKACRRYILVLNSYDAIKEALVKRGQCFSGRVPFFTETTFNNKNRQGLISKQFSEAQMENRRRAVLTLRHLLFAENRTLEGIVHRELGHLFSHVTNNPAAFYPKPILISAMFNIMHFMAFSERFPYDDPRLELAEMVASLIDYLDPYYEAFPFLAHLPPYKGRLKIFLARNKRFMEYLRNKIVENEREEGQENFVRVFKSMGEMDNDEKAFVLRDVIGGSFDIMAVQLCWFLVLLANNQPVQDKMREEVIRLTSREQRMPMLKDKPRMKYVEATVIEMFRCRPVGQITASHQALSDTQLMGYDIPAGTQVIANLWAVFRDPALWPEPDRFNPERFLNEAGEIVGNEKLIIFALGKRSCPGEELVRNLFFLIITSLVLHFRILPPEGQTTVRDEPRVFQICRPRPFMLRLEPTGATHGMEQGCSSSTF